MCTDDNWRCFIGASYDDNKRSTIGNIELIRIYSECRLSVTMHVSTDGGAHVRIEIDDSGFATRCRTLCHSSPIK
jgi:hypothetical protein